jgi:hypothetical protein
MGSRLNEKEVRKMSILRDDPFQDDPFQDDPFQDASI